MHDSLIYATELEARQVDSTEASAQFSFLATDGAPMNTDGRREFLIFIGDHRCPIGG
jgi:hypothetical protein